MSLHRKIAFVAFLSLTGTALAQPAAPAAPATATATTSSAAIKSDCVRPGNRPSASMASDNQFKAYAKSVYTYNDCMKKFIADQQAISKPLIDQAKPHVEAANAAIDEYNAFQKMIAESQAADAK